MRKQNRTFLNVCLLTTALLLPGCGGVKEPTPDVPTINAFTATPASIHSGQTSTLTWSVSNASAIELNGAVQTGSSLSVSPTSTTTYTLVAKNGAKSESRAATVTVAPPSPVQPTISAFAASPSSISAGQKSTLTWTVSDATSVEIDGQAQTGSSLVVTPTASKTYTLTARNGSLSATRTATVTVSAAPPPTTTPTISSFTATPPSIEAGQRSTLDWSVSGATSVELDGVVVTGTSRAVNPTTTTTYTLVARNGSQSTTRNATVTVTPATPTPVINTFSASPATITAGGSSILSWSVSNAVSVELDGRVVTGTSSEERPTTTTTYTLVAKNGSQSTTRTVTVTVAPAGSLIPTARWTFDDPANLMRAEIGQPLEAVGSPMAIPGPTASNGAVRLDTSTYLKVPHGISPNGGGNRVNQWTLIMDLRVRQFIDKGIDYNPLFDTGSASGAFNAPEVDVKWNQTVGGNSYTNVNPLVPWEWRRVALVLDSASAFRIYMDGTLGATETLSTKDGEYALYPLCFLGAASPDRRIEFHLAEVQMFARALTASEVASFGACPNQAGTPIFGPYLQNVKPQGITIMWETETSSTGRVEFGTTAAFGSSVPSTEADSHNGTRLHRAVLTGLTPGTSYLYRVVTERGPMETHTFRTAPEAAVDFSFGVWGDSQGANARHAGDRTVRILRDMVQNKQVDLAVSVGDMQGDAYNSLEVRTAFVETVLPTFGSRTPFFIAWGNHDFTDYGRQQAHSFLRAYADHPSTDRPGRNSGHPGHGSYAFTYAGCRFVCVDYEGDFDAAWIRAELQSNAAKAARFLFVFIHAPPYSERYDGGATSVRDLVPDFEAAKVAAVFSGDVHAYERGFLNGVYYVTTGSSSTYSSSDTLKADIPHITVGGFQNPPPDPINNGYVKEYMTVEVKGKTATVKMHGFSEDGSSPFGVLDTFTVSR